MKCCRKCQKAKPLSDFHKNKNFPDGHKNICKICYAAASKRYTAKWYQKNKDKHYKDISNNHRNCRNRLLPIKDNFLKGKSCHKCGGDSFKLVPRINGRYIPFYSCWTEDKYREKLKASKVICLHCIGLENHPPKKKTSKSI